MIVAGPPKSGVTSTLYSLLRKQDAYILVIAAYIYDYLPDEADALMGNDENCSRWIQVNAEGASADKRRERRTGRRRRSAES